MVRSLALAAFINGEEERFDLSFAARMRHPDFPAFLRSSSP